VRVVIIGGGFGGLEAAKALARSPVEITLIDRQNHHCFQPLLYQVATATLSPADVAWPIRSILSGQRNATVLMANAEGVAADQRLVRTSAGDFPYDPGHRNRRYPCVFRSRGVGAIRTGPEAYRRRHRNQAPDTKRF